jgi:CO dehydrogenase nickel-insertion accessory protein CooC1
VSLVSALLALSSAAAGLRTLLIDADPWLDIQRVWLGLDKARSLESLRGTSEGPEALVTNVSGGLELVSFGAGDVFERDHRALVRRVPSIFDAREVVIVDAGSRLESLDRCLDLQVGSILIVSGADAVALASTHAMIKAIGARIDLQPTVLFNRVDPEGAAAGESVLSEGARRFLGTVPAVAGHFPEDVEVRARLADGATLPESLADSTLPGFTPALMSRLQPWRVA